VLSGFTTFSQTVSAITGSGADLPPAQATKGLHIPGFRNQRAAAGGQPWQVVEHLVSYTGYEPFMDPHSSKRIET